MSAPATPSGVRAVRPVSLALLLAAAAALGYLSGYPGRLGPVVAVAGVVLAAALRATPWRTVAAYAPVPALAVLVLEAVASPVGLGVELIAGASGVAFLLWLADDPARPVGGSLRSLPTVAVPGLALGIAWSSAFFLPSGSVPLGVAGGLLALTVALVAFLVGRPQFFDREEA